MSQNLTEMEKSYIIDGIELGIITAIKVIEHQQKTFYCGKKYGCLTFK